MNCNESLKEIYDESNKCLSLDPGPTKAYEEKSISDVIGINILLF